MNLASVRHQPRPFVKPIRKSERKCVRLHSHSDANTIFKWIEDNGGTFKNVSIVEDKKGDRKIITKSPMKILSVFARIPRELMMDNDSDHEVTKMIPQEMDFRCDISLVCRLLREKALGEKSFWYPYINTFPDHVPCPLTEFIECHEEAIEYPQIKAELSAFKNVIAIAWLLLEQNNAHADASFEEFLWAVSIVCTRSCGLKDLGGHKDGSALIPGFDNFNHGGEVYSGVLRSDRENIATAEWFPMRSTKSLFGECDMCIGTTADVKQNEELVLTYKNDANDNYFLYYGFVPPLNPYDDYILFESLEESIDWYFQIFHEEKNSSVVEKMKTEAMAKGEAQPGILPGFEVNNIMVVPQKILMRVGCIVDPRLLAAYDHLHQLGLKPATREAIETRCMQCIESYRTSLLSDLKFMATYCPTSKHPFSLLYEAYSERIRLFYELHGLDPPPTSKVVKTMDLTYPEELIVTFLIYKKIILWDFLMGFEKKT